MSLVDLHGRTIGYLRLSVTDRCNLRCVYCMPEDGIAKKMHEDMLSFEAQLAIVKAAASLGVRKVRLTGGEPLVRKNLSYLVAGIKAVEGIEEVTMTTNGLLLKNQLPELKAAGLDRVNISLDSCDPLHYERITRGGKLADVLEGIQMAIDLGMHPVKVNVVLMRDDSAKDFNQFFTALPDAVELRFIELMPIGPAAAWHDLAYIAWPELMARHPEIIVDDDAALGNGPCRFYYHKKFKRRFGVINPISDHFCDRCNRIRVTADGMLKTCLHTSEEIDLRPALQSETDLMALIKRGILTKGAKHRLGENDFEPIQRAMNSIGG